MSGGDPYLQENKTLHNRLGLSDPEQLAMLEAGAAGIRLKMFATSGVTGPLDFDRLRATHRWIFQDVYDWAGETRLTNIAKMSHVGPAAVRHDFTSAARIALEAKQIFRQIAKEGELKGLSRQKFAISAARHFIAVNQLHFAREGNGRTQRRFFQDLAEAAGHTLAFDVVSRDRMIEASVQSNSGQPDMMIRLFQEISDPVRVAAMRQAIGAFERFDYNWNDTYLATAKPGQRYVGAFAGRGGDDFMIRSENRIIIAAVKDAPAVAAGQLGPGETMEFLAGAEPKPSPSTAPARRKSRASVAHEL
jgi:cell filamentation protein